MNETNEINEFGEIKAVLDYLEQIKSDLHNKTLSEQIKFKEELKNRLDKRQIQMLLGRLEDQYEIRKALSYLVTALFAIVSFAIGSFTKFYVSNLAETELNSYLAPIIIFLFYILALATWIVLSYAESSRLRKISCYKRLLQECLDEIPEKRYFRRKV
ncbi:hypothetical protein [Bacillus haynesii]|uniref:hypothetical protein n=1 Tax=Bacillus haynesii TaxID=1925021 RepID=UPI00227F7643|nr:hypothetical protein [Bacillus haynesii]MCY8001072.1 hypothetical protein [Bacillus haynesii]MCY8755668.1 hypothetical protein [Bacillus haynesii]MCY9218312.1 hypothetical protein [Bacillus haynesii]